MNKQFKTNKYPGGEETDGVCSLDHFGLSDTEHTPFQSQMILLHLFYLILLHRFSKREENSL